jgi:hypothetical protein
MSLSSGPGRRLSRRDRENRAYLLVLIGGGAAVVAVLTFILAVVGVLSLFLPIVAAIVAVVCFFLFRRAVS